MKFPILFLTSTIFLTTAQKENDFGKVSKGNNIFSSRIYNQLSKKPGNVFFSPFSAYTILSLVAQGASGDTLEEFNKVLQVKKEISANEFKGIMKLVKNVKNIALHLANKVYIKVGYKLNEDFKTVAGDTFLTEVESINFLPALSAIDNMNGWCLSKTKNKIKDVVTENDLDEETRFVLLNAIYFKGSWHLKFNKSVTERKPFYLNEQKFVDVNMMHMTNKFRHRNDLVLGADLLEMDYKNRDFSMIFILPHKKNGIHEVEKKLASYDLTIQANWRLEPIIVQLPKFRIQTKIDMKDLLMKIGLRKAFGNADFSKLLLSNEKFRITNVIQKTFVEVNEQGAEAAAATAVIGERISSARTPEFIANHPFIFAIQMKSGPHRTTLFMGKISNPL